MKKEKILIAVIVLLVVLVGGTFYIKTRGNQQEEIAQQQAKLNHVRDLLNEATTIGQFDKTKAAELLAAGEKEAMEVLNSRYLRGEAVKMLDEVAKNRDGIDEVRRIANPTVLADLSLKRATVSALGLLNLKERIFSFEYNALYEMVLDKLQDPLTIDSLEAVILGTPDSDRGTLLFLTRTGKMLEFDGSRFAPASTRGGLWKNGVDMKIYNQRVYVLDSARNQVWRYQRLREGYDVGEAYNQNADLKNAVALAIDTSIYVLNSDATITQLYQGQKQEYPLRRLPLNPLTKVTRLFTTSELNQLYLLEPSKQRVVVFRKDPKNGGAVYQAQYVFENVGELRDLVVAENRLYVVDEKKVYFVNLSGL